MSNWTHPLCLDCWYDGHPDQFPVRIREPELERCCNCGDYTSEGIYVRADPAGFPNHAATQHGLQEAKEQV